MSVLIALNLDIVFGFTLDINCQQEKDRYWNDYIHRFKPSDEIYDNFGTNKETVRNEYNAICETMVSGDNLRTRES